MAIFNSYVVYQRVPAMFGESGWPWITFIGVQAPGCWAGIQHDFNAELRLASGLSEIYGTTQPGYD